MSTQPNISHMHADLYARNRMHEHTTKTYALRHCIGYHVIKINLLLWHVHGCLMQDENQTAVLLVLDVFTHCACACHS